MNRIHYYLSLARTVAQKSKDPSTKTGAVIVDPQGRVVSTGYNGFPRQMPDRPEWYTDRDEKYSRIVHCTAPQHRTLTKNLHWVEQGQLKVGDELIAFEEEPTRYSGRQYQTAIVEAVQFAKEPVYRVVFSDETSIFSTAEHQWLLGIRSNNPRRWRRTDELAYTPRGRTLTKDGVPNYASKIYRLFEPWKSASDYDAVYLAGILDGEGSISGKGNTLQFAQRPGLVLDKTLDILKNRGNDFHVWSHSSPMTGGLGKKDCIAAHIRGPLVNRLALLGTVRPERLISKLNPNNFGRVHAHPDRIRVVMAVEPAGEQEIVKVQTSSRTLIIEGFPSHNCEMNALIFARQSCEGCTLYTWPFLSCDRCAVHMLQAGILNFIAPVCPPELATRWEESFKKTRHYVNVCGGTTAECVNWEELP